MSDTLSITKEVQQTVFGAVGEIDFMVRAMIAMGSMDEASPTLLRAYSVRMLDLVQLVTLSMEGLDTSEILNKLQGVTV